MDELETEKTETARDHRGRPTRPVGGGPGNWKRELAAALFSRAGLLSMAAIAAVVGLRLALNGYEHRQLSAVLPLVRVEHPARRDFDRTLSLPADVEAIEQASLYSHVSGYLKELYHDEGDPVAQGTLLATIDAPDVVAEYNRDKADYELQEVTRKRYEQLLKGQVVSEQEYDTIKAQADEALARFKNAEANMDYTRITAPFTGSIARRYLYPGDLVTEATKSTNQSPIFLMVNENRLRIAVDVPQSDLAGIHLGHPADIEVDSLPGVVYHGAISRVDALLNEEAKTQRVLIDIDNPGDRLHAGMYATVILHLRHDAGAMAVPIDSVQGPPDKPYVNVVEGDRVRRVPVQTGLSQGDWVEIRSGLSFSDEVVLGSAQVLADGEAVRSELAAPATGLAAAPVP